MILLDSTSSVEAVLAGAATTQPQYYLSFVDTTDTTYTPQENHGALNSTTPVTLLSAPSAGTRRQLKYLSVFNRDNVAVTLRISLNVSSTLTTLWYGTLDPNEMVQFSDGAGWVELDAGGIRKTQTVYAGAQFIRDGSNQLSSGTVIPAGMRFGIDGATVTAGASTIPWFEMNPGLAMTATSVNAFLASVMRIMPIDLLNDLNMSRIRYFLRVTSSNAATTLTITMLHGLYTKSSDSLNLYTTASLTSVFTYATSRSSVWQGLKEWSIGCSWSLTRGQYWYASKAFNAGANALLGEFLYPPVSYFTTTAGYLGSASTAVRPQPFRMMAAYSVSNTSTLPATILSSELRQTNVFVMPYQIWQT